MIHAKFKQILLLEWMEAHGGEEKGYLPLRLLSETIADMFNPDLATGFSTEAMVARREWIDAHKRSRELCEYNVSSELLLAE